MFFYQRYLRENYHKKSKKRIQLNYPDLYKIINETLLKFELEDYHAQTFWSDAYFILNKYLNLKPNETLELGSGISTLVLAYAAKCMHQKDGIVRKVTSLDENFEYLSTLDTLIPEDFKKFVKLIYSKPKIEVFDEMLGITYEKVPYQKFDMIYIDGPQFRPSAYQDSKFYQDESHLQNLSSKPFDADLLKIIHLQERNLEVIIDQRISTVWQLHKFLIKIINTKKYYFLPKKTVFKFKKSIKHFNKIL